MPEPRKVRIDRLSLVGVSAAQRAELTRAIERAVASAVRGPEANGGALQARIQAAAQRAVNATLARSAPQQPVLPLKGGRR
jgi:hypothetical protein